MVRGSVDGCVCGAEGGGPIAVLAIGVSPVAAIGDVGATTGSSATGRSDGASHGTATAIVVVAAVVAGWTAAGSDTGTAAELRMRAASGGAATTRR